MLLARGQYGRLPMTRARVFIWNESCGEAHAISRQNWWVCSNQWRTQEFFSGGVQQIQLRTEDRENGDLEAVAP